LLSASASYFGSNILIEHQSRRQVDTSYGVSSMNGNNQVEGGILCDTVGGY
jgi:hypothetical protein